MKGLNKIPLRHCFKVLSGSTPKSGEGFYWDGDICWVTPEDISNLSEGYRLYDTKRKITEEGYNETGVTLVPINSLVLTKRAPIGLLAILGVEACSNQGCFLLVPKQEIVPEFTYSR
jgi:type I restriction enzyme S subunit